MVNEDSSPTGDGVSTFGHHGQGLQDDDGRVKVAAVKVALDFHLKSGGARPPDKGLTIVLSTQVDPLKDKAKPAKHIDLTMGAGAIEVKPSAPTMPALPPGPAQQVAAALEIARVAKKSTPETVAKYVDHSGRLDARYWVGDCPRCKAPQALTWTANAEGRAAEFVCVRDCKEADIIAALKARAAQPKEAPPPGVLPKALQDEHGADMHLQYEPPILREVPPDDEG